MGQKKCCLFKDLKALQNKGKCEKVQFIKFVVALWKHFFWKNPWNHRILIFIEILFEIRFRVWAGSLR